MKDACWLNISTAATKLENHFTSLMRNKVIKTLEITLCCDECTKLGKMEMCSHRVDDVPHWSCPENRRLVESLYPPAKRYKYALENLGIRMDGGPQIFPAERIRELFAKPHVALHRVARRHVFVTLDPAAGSDQRETRGSDFAVLSAVQPGIIVGMDAIDMTGCNIDHEARVLRHIAGVLRIPELQSAIVVLIIENNCAGNLLGGLINKIRDAFPHRVVLMCTKPNKPGVVTTAANKEAMALELREMLNNHAISIYDKWVTEFQLNEKATMEQSREALLNEAREQLINYSRWVKESDDVHQKTKITFSGKLYRGARDDLAMVWQLWNLHARDFFALYQQYGTWH